MSLLTRFKSPKELQKETTPSNDMTIKFPSLVQQTRCMPHRCGLFSVRAGVTKTTSRCRRIVSSFSLKFSCINVQN